MPARHTARNANGVILGVIIAAQVLWSGIFIWDSSFVIGGERYFCLFDDAMISMSYARNLLEGFGLTWARFGEPVEGYTHPLWLVPMIVVNALGLELASRSLLMQLLSLAGLVANVIAVSRLCSRHFSVGSASYPWIAALLTAAFYPLNYWALLGMETSYQALLVTLGVSYALDMVHLRRDRVVALAVVFSLSALMRLDMLIFVGVVLGYIVARRGHRSAAWRRWLIAAAILFVPLVAYEIFRLAYFGDPLPNTYYLKMTGVPLLARIYRGWAVTGPVVLPMLASFAGTLGCALALSVRSRYRHFVLPAALVIAYFAYSIWVGGDAWEYFHLGTNRFQTIVMPMLFVLVTALVNVIGHWIEQTPDRGMGRSLVPVLGLALAVGIGAQVNGLDDDEAAADTAWSRLTLDVAPELVVGHYRYTASTLALSEVLPAERRVGVVWAGIPTFFADFRMVDVLGYNDRVIGQGPARRPWDGESEEYFYPGHMKWNLETTILTHRPDLFMEVWRPDGSDQATLRAHGYAPRGEMWLGPEAQRELAR